MSLINTIRRPNSVLMLSDGVGLDENANVATIATKVGMMPQINAVIGIRGNLVATGLVAGCLMAEEHKFATYESFKAALVENVRDKFDTLRDTLSLLQGDDCLDMDVIVAGWSETSGPDSYLLRTMEGTPTPAWQIIDVGPVLLTPSNDEIFKAEGSALADQSRAISDAELIAVAEKQRRYTEPYGSSRIQTSMVGGFAQLTSVTATDITTKVIHRWPDMVGKRIAA